MPFEVITTRDKEQRDRMFDDLRANGNKQEKQVVKFSGVERVLINEEPAFTISASGTKRPQYVSTWSVAYPVTPGYTLTQLP